MQRTSGSEFPNVGRIGAYKDWNDERHANFINRLLKVIENTKIYQRSGQRLVCGTELHMALEALVMVTRKISIQILQRRHRDILKKHNSNRHSSQCDYHSHAEGIIRTS